MLDTIVYCVCLRIHIKYVLPALVLHQEHSHFAFSFSKFRYTTHIQTPCLLKDVTDDELIHQEANVSILQKRTQVGSCFWCIGHDSRPRKHWTIDLSVEHQLKTGDRIICVHTSQRCVASSRRVTAHVRFRSFPEAAMKKKICHYIYNWGF